MSGGLAGRSQVHGDYRVLGAQVADVAPTVSDEPSVVAAQTREL
jgi:hypothetical protein